LIVETIVGRGELKDVDGGRCRKKSEQKYSTSDQTMVEEIQMSRAVSLVHKTRAQLLTVELGCCLQVVEGSKIRGFRRWNKKSLPSS